MELNELGKTKICYGILFVNFEDSFFLESLTNMLETILIFIFQIHWDDSQELFKRVLSVRNNILIQSN